MRGGLVCVGLQKQRVRQHGCTAAENLVTFTLDHPPDCRQATQQEKGGGTPYCTAPLCQLFVLCASGLSALAGSEPRWQGLNKKLIFFREIWDSQRVLVEMTTLASPADTRTRGVAHGDSEIYKVSFCHFFLISYIYRRASPTPNGMEAIGIIRTKRPQFFISFSISDFILQLYQIRLLHIENSVLLRTAYQQMRSPKYFYYYFLLFN